jgi:DNA-directed RNA polymerase subunit beta'
MVEVVAGRSGEVRVLEPKSNTIIVTYNIPYGSIMEVKDGGTIKKGDVICTWDPYNAVIISDVEGTIEFDNIIEGVTVREEGDDQTGFFEKVVIESKDKTKNPMIRVVVVGGDSKEFNLPVAAHINVNNELPATCRAGSQDAEARPERPHPAARPAQEPGMFNRKGVFKWP